MGIKNEKSWLQNDIRVVIHILPKTLTEQHK
jgi:hypothetical protein